MRRALRVTRNAERQIRQAADWWRENRGDASDLLHTELAKGFELVSAHPSIGATALDPDLPGVRRLLLSRIQYHLYYRSLQDDTVEVLSFWHTSREFGPSLGKFKRPPA